MKPVRIARLLLCLLAPLGAAVAQPAPSEAWPTQAVRIVVPFAPGGGTDIVARTLGRKLGERLGQTVIIDNKPGAATVIGTDAVAKARPDGHTLLVSGSSTFTVNPALRSRLPYDAQRDLAPVALVARAPLVLMVPASSGLRTLDDLFAAARAQPGKLNYATFGSGSAPHLAGALLGLSAGVSFQDIPYKGSSPALMGLIGGELHLGIDTVAAAAPHLRSGKLRALAIVGGTRSSLLPGVATLAELKRPEASFDAWYALAAPGGTPPAVLQRLERELAVVLRDPQVQSDLRAQALEPTLLGAAALRELMQSEVARYRALAHRAAITVD